VTILFVAVHESLVEARADSAQTNRDVAVLPKAVIGWVGIPHCGEPLT